MRGWIAGLALACAPSATTSVPGPESDASTDVVADARPLRVAVIADPHVTAEGPNADRLRRAVAWFSSAHAEDPFDLAVVLGDISWNDGHDLARQILDDLPVVWAPIAGDNVVQSGDQAGWDRAYAPVFDALAAATEDFARAPVQVPLPDGASAWFQSFRFSVRGVTFLGLDWSNRQVHALWGEVPVRHQDLPGGTWDWYTAALDAPSVGPSARVVLLTHEPMMYGPGGFSADDWAEIVAVSAPHRDALAVNLAGHLHVDADVEADDTAGFDAWLVDATWDDELTVAVLTGTAEETSFAWQLERVRVP